MNRHGLHIVGGASSKLASPTIFTKAKVKGSARSLFFVSAFLFFLLVFGVLGPIYWEACVLYQAVTSALHNAAHLCDAGFD